MTGHSARARVHVRAWRGADTLGKQENGSGDPASPVMVGAAYSRGRDRRAVDDQAAVHV